MRPLVRRFRICSSSVPGRARAVVVARCALPRDAQSCREAHRLCVAHAHQVSQFLLAIAVKPPGGGEPSIFRTMCKVGTGYNDAELADLRAKLAPLLIPGGRDRSLTPACYDTTGATDETPDFWISDPRRSVVLTVKGDLRLIETNSFKTPVSVRFPRVVPPIRWDKPWADVFSDVELAELIHENAGKLSVDVDGIGGGAAHGGARHRGVRSHAPARHGRGVRGIAPGLVGSASLKAIKPEGSLFADEVVCVLPALGRGQEECDEVRGLVQLHGGTWSYEIVKPEGEITEGHEIMPTTRVVVPCYDPVAYPKQAQAAAQEAAAASALDVLKPSWVRDCIDAGRVLQPAPRHRWFFTLGSKPHEEGLVDHFGDRCGAAGAAHVAHQSGADALLPRRPQQLDRARQRGGRTGAAQGGELCGREGGKARRRSA